MIKGSAKKIIEKKNVDSLFPFQVVLIYCLLGSGIENGLIFSSVY